MNTGSSHIGPPDHDPLGTQSAGTIFVVRLYGDSLSLPRMGDGIPVAMTFGERFAAWLQARAGAARISLYNRSQGGVTAPELARLGMEDAAYFGNITPQWLILQSGIVDCAPRPVPDWLRRCIGRLPGFLRRLVVCFLHHNRARIQRAGCVWRRTEPAPFRAAVRAWLTAATGTARGVLVVNIAPPTDAGEAHSPGLQAGVQVYNRILAEAVAEHGSLAVRLVNVHDALADGMGAMERCINPVDGHHLTADGHELYFTLLKEAFLALPESASLPA